MIVGNLKPVEEIAASIAGLKNVLVVGCGSCVTVCLSGGDREARQLADELSLPLYYPDSPPPAFIVNGIVRQCEKARDGDLDVGGPRWAGLNPALLP